MEIQPPAGFVLPPAVTLASVVAEPLPKPAVVDFNRAADVEDLVAS